MLYKNRLYQLTSFMFCSLICLQMTICRCRTWFGPAWSSSEWSHLAWCSTVKEGAHYVNLGQPHIFKHQIYGKNSSCIQANIVLNITHLSTQYSLQLFGLYIYTHILLLDHSPSCLLMMMMTTTMTTTTTTTC